MSKPFSLDDLHGDTIVSQLTITLARSGCMKLEGSITDEKYALYLLDTAQETIRNYHKAQKRGERSSILVPAHDTALTGTLEEKMLLNARHELADAMNGR